MRRLLALLAAIGLAASTAGSSLAAGPTTRVNTFVGSFDMLDGDGNVMGHVVANFKEPSYGQLVPGSLDITWQPSAVFPFMDLKYPPVQESHAQLTGSFFGPETWDGSVIVAGVEGFLCDYTAPGNAGCRQFSAIFIQPSDPTHPRMVAWVFPDWNSPADSYLVGKGAFALTYAGPTGS